MMVARHLWRILENLVLATFLAMLILAIAQVFFRYVMNISVPWTEEGARWFYIWQIFLGSALAMKNQLHLRITFLRDKIPPSIRNWLEIGSAVLGLIFLGGIWWGSFKMMQTVYPVYAGSFSIRMTYLYLSLPISIGLMMYLTLRDIHNQIKENRLDLKK
jgi:TRAP-type C4-dicarboxylate transport system permease small subunit